VEGAIGHGAAKGREMRAQGQGDGPAMEARSRGRGAARRGVRKWMQVAGGSDNREEISVCCGVEREKINKKIEGEKKEEEEERVF